MPSYHTLRPADSERSAEHNPSMDGSFPTRQNSA